MEVTIKNIAEKLNLHRSSVSYALSGRGSLSAETRKLVCKTAENMGYVPNVLAKKVSTGRSNLAGLVMPNILFAYGEFVQHVFRLFADAGLDTNVSLTEFSEDREAEVVRHLLGNCMAGLIIKSCYSRWDDVSPGHPLRIAAAKKLPVVVFGYPVEGSPFSCVNMDMFLSGNLLGRHLAAKGRRKIKILVPYPPPFQRNVSELLRGLKESGPEKLDVSVEWIDAENIPSGNSSGKPSQYGVQLNELLAEAGIRAGETMMKKIIDGKELPDAVICLSENSVKGVWNEAAKNGLEIPGRIGLACAERNLILSFSPVPITATAVPMRLLAESAVQLLLDLVENKESPPRTISLEPALHVGEST